MDLQTFIVVIIIAAALAFAGRSIYRRSRSFSQKTGCGGDCGCGGASNTLTS